jgi:hypothetical protein
MTSRHKQLKNAAIGQFHSLLELCLINTLAQSVAKQVERISHNICTLLRVFMLILGALVLKYNGGNCRIEYNDPSACLQVGLVNY